VKSLPLLAAAMVLATAAHGQERTAGQANDAQVNWSALKSSIDLVSSQNKAIAATVDKMTACSAKHMVYAPGTTGADYDGCATVGEYTGPLIAGSHTGDDCLDSGGRPKTIGNGYVCVFGSGILKDASLIGGTDVCPSGWSAYGNWSSTLKTKCNGGGAFGSSCTTGFHGFGKVAQESCGYSTTVMLMSGHTGGMHNAPQPASCPATMLLKGCI